MIRLFLFLIFIPTTYASDDMTPATDNGEYAEIILFRNQLVGNGATPGLLLNSKAITRLPSYSISTLKVPAGVHVLAFDFNGERDLEVSLLPNQKIYLEIHVDFWRRGYDFKNIDHDTFEALREKLKDNGVINYDDPFPILLSDNTRYNGELKFGMPNGTGELFNPVNKNIATGNWVNGRLKGISRIVFDNGDIFEGMFDGGPKGYGTFIYANGMRVSGVFKGWELNGPGQYKLVDGTRFEGNFTNSELDGSGKLITKDGYEYVGNFSKNKFISGVIKDPNGVTKNYSIKNNNESDGVIENILASIILGAAHGISTHYTNHNARILTPNSNFGAQAKRPFQANNLDTKPAYESSFGNKYQYDLSKPIDKLNYEIDINAQLRDELDVTPTRELERDLGQHGGGIYD